MQRRRDPRPDPVRPLHAHGASVPRCRLAGHRRAARVGHQDDVVEIVRNPSGQLSDGVELLGMDQLFFELPSFGDVAGNVDDAGSAPLGIVET